MSRILLALVVKGHAPRPNPIQVAGLHARALKRVPFLKGRLTLETFAKGVAHRFPGDPPEPGEITDYIDSLRFEELAVAVSCEAGDERA